jgi:nitrogen fixation/metabolism regulation signal transduction histidine kinase
VVIKIKDNRQGMSSEVKQKIFDYLFTTKKVGKDTGLGLSISRQIVEETHGCKLSYFRACWEKVRNLRSPCRFDKIYSPP